MSSEVDQIELGRSLHSSQLMTFLLRSTGERRGEGNRSDGGESETGGLLKSLTDVLRGTAVEEEKTRGLLCNIIG